MTQGILLSLSPLLHSLLSVIAFQVNMLLAEVTPKMLVADPSILLHAKDFQSGMCNSQPTLSHHKSMSWTEITSQDGLVGAITWDGKFIITSPNCKNICDPPLGGDRTIFHRSNLRFGDDDELQWPQPFLKNYGHLCCIRKRPPQGDIMEVMWELPQRADFLQDSGGLCGVGKLHYRVLEGLHRWSEQVLDRSAEPKFRAVPLMTQLAQVLKLLLHHLEFISVTFRATQIIVCETQRILLELRALLDYQELYRPRMDMAASFSVNASIMGAFTNDLVECDTLFRIGIPVWLIRPYTELSSIRVKALTQIQFASGTIPLDPPSGSSLPTVYVGPANCLEKYVAIANYVSRLLRFPDPFGSVRAIPLAHPPPSSAHASNPAGSKSQRFTPCNAPYSFFCSS
jgi:hypothetical protein